MLLDNHNKKKRWF